MKFGKHCPTRPLPLTLFEHVDTPLLESTDRVCLTHTGQYCMEGEGTDFKIYWSFMIHKMVQKDLREDTQLLRGPRDRDHLE